MAASVLNKQLVDNWITGPPIGDHLKVRWLQAPHTAHQVWSGPHEGDLRLLQNYQFSAQSGQDMEPADTSGIPPCLERKLTRQNERSSPGWTSCGKAPGGVAIMLGTRGRTHTTDDGDEYGDSHDDNDEAHLDGAAGRFEYGEYPPRVQWLRERDHQLAKPAAGGPATAGVPAKRARNEKAVTVLATRSSEQQRTRALRPRSGSRRKGARSRGPPPPPTSGGEEDPPSGIAGTTSREEGDGSKRRRCSGDSVIVIRPVELGGGSLILDELPGPAIANADASGVGIDVPSRRVAALPVTGRVSEAYPLGLRRSPRLRIGHESSGNRRY